MLYDLAWSTLLTQPFLATVVQVVFNYEALFYHFSTDLFTVQNGSVCEIRSKWGSSLQDHCLICGSWCWLRQDIAELARVISALGELNAMQNKCCGCIIFFVV